jgi:two-component system, LytTR family, response regulator AlgR
MRVLIVDDESTARERLKVLLSQIDARYELAGTVGDSSEAVACCQTQPIDLVLLDAEMPGMNGLDVSRHLAALDRPPAIILMTDDPVPVNGIGGRIIGRLGKPIQREQLGTLLGWFAQADRRDRTNTPIPGTPVSPVNRPFEIKANYRNRLYKVLVDDVIYLRADQKYVTVRHPKGELLVDLSLRFFEGAFPDLFLRIHRNALVARSRFSGLQRRPDGSVEARMDGCEDALVVSRRHLTRIRRWLQQTKPRESAKRA